jgi:hypothetical protein
MNLYSKKICWLFLSKTEQRHLRGVGHRFNLGMLDSLVADKLGRGIAARDVDERALVAHGVAVVGRREHRDTLAAVHDLVALVLDLVAAHHIFEAVLLEEGAGDVRAELHADASLALRTTARVLRVGPHQVAHEAVLGRLTIAVDLANVVQSDAVLGEQAAVHHDHLGLDDVAEREEIEELGEYVEHLRAVLGFDLAIEAVHLVHVYALVVSFF